MTLKGAKAIRLCSRKAPNTSLLIVKVGPDSFKSLFLIDEKEYWSDEGSGASAYIRAKKYIGNGFELEVHHADECERDAVHGNQT